MSDLKEWMNPLLSAENRVLIADGEIERLRNDLADSLDCKAFRGPTALLMLIQERDTLRAQLAAAEARADETRRLYNELLHQVGMKYPGETRHETAIRYLRLAEIHVCGPAVAGLHGEVKP